MADLAWQQAYQQLQLLDSQSRVVIVHPKYPPQHLLLHPFWQQEDNLYVRLEGSSLKQGELMDSLESALADQMAQGNLKDVRQLVLDEWDRAQPGELNAFLSDLLPRLGDGRVVLMGRGLPEFFNNDDALRQTTHFVPINPDRMQMDYVRDENKQVLVEVSSLGQGAVTINGQPVVDWGGDLPRALFFYLIDRGIVTRGDIFSAFWPGLSLREATNVFHVTKRKIADKIGIDLTTYWSGFYRISPKIELVYDVALFVEAVQDSAVAASDDAQRLLFKAIQHYRGDYLVSMNENIPWVQKRRAELKQNYGEALFALGKIVDQKGDPQRALGYYTRAFATNPQREDIVDSVMLLCANMGRYADALSIYKRLESELMQHLSISPTHKLQKMAGEMRAKMQEIIH